MLTHKHTPTNQHTHFVSQKKDDAPNELKYAKSTRSNTIAAKSNKKANKTKWTYRENKARARERWKKAARKKSAAVRKEWCDDERQKVHVKWSCNHSVCCYTSPAKYQSTSAVKCQALLQQFCCSFFASCIYSFKQFERVGSFNGSVARYAIQALSAIFNSHYTAILNAPIQCPLHCNVMKVSCAQCTTAASSTQPHS